MNANHICALVAALGLIFYVQENISEKPSILRAVVFVSALIEGFLYMAFQL